MKYLLDTAAIAKCNQNVDQPFYFRSTETVRRELYVSYERERLQTNARVKKRTAVSNESDKTRLLIYLNWHSQHILDPLPVYKYGVCYSLIMKWVHF